MQLGVVLGRFGASSCTTFFVRVCLIVMTAYLTVDTFKLTTTIPASYVDDLETRAPGFVAQRLLVQSAMIDARLSKRYAVPFHDPPPLAVIDWLTRIVTLDCWQKRGYSSTDEQFAEYKAQATTAWAEVREAANSAEGLFDLPLLSTGVGGSAISRGNTRFYSEASPYVWTDLQARVGHEEDKNGTGTSS